MAHIYLRSIDTRSVLDIVEAVKKFPRIKDQEARKLARSAQSGNHKAEDALTEGSSWYVINLALRYHNFVPKSDLEDLIQDGYLGLLAAIRNYNPDSEADFLTYASVCVSNQIVRGLNKSINIVSIPRFAIALRPKIKTFDEAYVLVHECSPTVEEEMAATGASREAVLSAKEFSVANFDNVDTEDGAYVIPNEDDGLLNDETREYLNYLVSRLPEREQYIIVHSFGLNGEDEEDLPAIALKFGVTTERIRQLRKKALETMRAA